MKCWLKTIAMVVFVRFYVLFQQELSNLVFSASPSIVLTNGVQTLSLYPVTVGFSNTINALAYNGAPVSLSQYFEFYFIQTTVLVNEQFKFTYTNLFGTAAQFSLVIKSNNQNQLLVQTCNKTSKMLSDRSSCVINCDNLNGGHFQIGVVLTIDQLIYYYSPWTISSNPSTTGLYYLYKFVVSIQYVPQLNYNLTYQHSFNYMNIQLQAYESQLDYIGIMNSNFKFPSCPSHCYGCDTNGMCLSCSYNYTLNNKLNACTCSLRVVSFLQTQNSNITIGSLVKRVYENVQLCSSLQNTFASCLNAVNQINQPLYFNMYTNSSFNTENGITIGISYPSISNFNTISSACLAKFTLLFSLALDSSQGLFIELAEPVPFSLYSTQVIDYTGIQFCNNYTFTKFGFMARVCPITTSFLFRDPTYNQTLFQRNNSYMILHDSITGLVTSSYFLNNFIAGSFYNLTTSNWTSGLVCLDVACLTFATSANVTNSDILFVIAAISDPLFLIYNPVIYPTLLINNSKRNSLLLSQTRVLPNQIMFAISMDSIQLFNQTNVVVLMSYGVASTIAYNKTEVISFSVFIPRNTLFYPTNPPFLKSCGFIWLIVTLAIIMITLIWGPIAFCISKCSKKEKSEDDYFKRDQLGTGRFLSMEMTSPRGKSNLQFLMNSQKNSPPPPEANSILQKLLG